MYHCSTIQCSLNFSNVTESNMYYPTGKYNIEDIDYLKLLKKMCTIEYTTKHLIRFIIWYTSGHMIVLICTLQVVLFLQPETTLQTALECAVPLAIVIQMGLKNLLYAHRHKKILSLKEYIDKNFWPLSCAGDKEFEDEVRKDVKILEYACAFHLFSTFFSVVFYCHYPLMEYGPDEFPMPMKIWIPYDMHIQWRYYFTKYLITYNVLLGLIILIAFDFLYLFFVVHTSIQFKILRKMLQKINEVEGYDDFTDMNLINSDKYQEIINNRINICIDHHSKLIWFGNEIQSFFSVPVALQLLFSLGCLCLSGFEIIEEERVFKKFKWSWYVNGIVMELLFYCLAGSYLEYQSEKLLPTSYQSQWYLGNRRFRKKLVLLEKISLERIVNISAFGVIPVGNISLLQLFKIAFSCITVLQAMNEKTEA